MKKIKYLLWLIGLSFSVGLFYLDFYFIDILSKSGYAWWKLPTVCIGIVLSIILGISSFEILEKE